MATLADVEKKIAAKIETFALAVKENKIILSRGKELTTRIYWETFG